VTKTQTIIHLNGKSFDAVTGKPVGSTPHGVSKMRSLDGVVHAQKPARPLQKISTPTIMPKPARKTHTPAPAAKVRGPHTSKTLMRHSVHKPVEGHKAALHPVVRTDILATTPSASVMSKLSVGGIDKHREARASRVGKSKLVSRFGTLQASSAPALVSAAPEPISQIITPPSPQQKVVTLQPHLEGMPRQRPMDMFQKAVMQANSHVETTPKSRPHRAARKTSHHRLASASAAVLAVVLVGGFLAYQNAANLTLRMASHQAGFAATLPGYRPSGFSVGRFAYGPGNVTIRFVSNSDAGRHFAITEKPSSWDSDSLLNNFVATVGQDYQTVQAAGRTLYVVGSVATWVNNGIWYQIDTGNALSPNQLIDLASSM
jgi:hypothetical protein